jgi:hypothetical protein
MSWMTVLRTVLTQRIASPKLDPSPAKTLFWTTLWPPYAPYVAACTAMQFVSLT